MHNTFVNFLLKLMKYAKLDNYTIQVTLSDQLDQFERFRSEKYSTEIMINVIYFRTLMCVLSNDLSTESPIIELSKF